MPSESNYGNLYDITYILPMKKKRGFSPGPKGYSLDLYRFDSTRGFPVLSLTFSNIMSETNLLWCFIERDVVVVASAISISTLKDVIKEKKSKVSIPLTSEARNV